MRWIFRLITLHWKFSLLFVGFSLFGVAALSWGLQQDPVESEVVEETSPYRSVQMALAGDLGEEKTSVTSIGRVQATQDADVHAEMTGQVQRVGVKKGQRVTAGDVILELEHAVLDAQVRQAQARVNAAVAILDKLVGGERPEQQQILEQQLIAAEQEYQRRENGTRQEEREVTEVQLVSARGALDDAETELQNAQTKADRDIDALYSSGRDAVLAAAVTADKVLSQNIQDVIQGTRVPERTTCDLQFVSSDQNSIRPQCFDAIKASEDVDVLAAEISQNVSQDRLIELLRETEQHLDVIRVFLNQLLEVTNEGVQDKTGLVLSSAQLTSFKNAVTSAQNEVEALSDRVTTQYESVLTQFVSNRTSVDSATTRVNQAQGTVFQLEKQLLLQEAGARPEELAIQQSQIRQLELQLEIAQKGARSEDVRNQQASVSQAQADLSVAVVNRDKAIIRAPVSGTIIELPFKLGDLVNNQALVATVVNTDLLEVQSFVSAEDYEYLRLGGIAYLPDSGVEGEITVLSPALQQDSFKAEVITELLADYESLLVGQSVVVNFEIELDQEVLRIPLESIRMQGRQAQVLTVDKAMRVRVIPVEIGRVLGEQVEIKNLAPDQPIITDISGLREGEIVSFSSDES